jgi:hypothetical protein
LVPVSLFIKAKIIWHPPARHPQVSGTKVNLEASWEVLVIQHTHCRVSCSVAEGALEWELENGSLVLCLPLLLHPQSLGLSNFSEILFP